MSTRPSAPAPVASPAVAGGRLAHVLAAGVEDLNLKRSKGMPVLAETDLNLSFPAQAITANSVGFFNPVLGKETRYVRFNRPKRTEAPQVQDALYRDILSQPSPYERAADFWAVLNMAPVGNPTRAGTLAWLYEFASLWEYSPIKGMARDDALRITKLAIQRISNFSESQVTELEIRTIGKFIAKILPKWIEYDQKEYNFLREHQYNNDNLLLEDKVFGKNDLEAYNAQ